MHCTDSEYISWNNNCFLYIRTNTTSLQSGFAYCALDRQFLEPTQLAWSLHSATAECLAIALTLSPFLASVNLGLSALTDNSI